MIVFVSNNLNSMNLHKEFVRLGRERNRITYKLLALLPEIDRQRVWAEHGYGSVFEYAAKIAGLSSGVVRKALRLDKKLENKPHLQKVVESQGINKVAIVAGLATEDNEKDLAEKVENMSKGALQEYSKQKRGHSVVSWQIELDEEMMFMFLKLKKKFGKNLSNKDCLRKILEFLQGENGQLQLKKSSSNKNRASGDTSGSLQKNCAGKSGFEMLRESCAGKTHIVSRAIKKSEKAKLSERCSHPGCHRPAEVIHHPERFANNPNHNNLKPLCRIHHEFAHNGISEPMVYVDYLYRKYREEALL